MSQIFHLIHSQDVTGRNVNFFLQIYLMSGCLVWNLFTYFYAGSQRHVIIDNWRNTNVAKTLT